MLRLRNVEAGYGSLTVLRRVTLHVSPGEIVAILGANGAGKTTLLRTVAGLVRARGGEILFRTQDVRRLPPERTVALGCSLVPEGRQVFASMPVWENLLLGAHVQYARGRRREVEEDLARVHRLFPVLGARGNQLAGTLSGGEQQMLAIGRALMARPRVLLLDEPSLGLSPILVQQIFSIIKEINGQGTTILLVEQNALQALAIANRGYVLQTGHVVLSGDAHTLREDEMVRKAYLGEA